MVGPTQAVRTTFWIDDHNRIQAAMNVNVWDVIRPLT